MLSAAAAAESTMGVPPTQAEAERPDGPPGVDAAAARVLGSASFSTLMHFAIAAHEREVSKARPGGADAVELCGFASKTWRDDGTALAGQPSPGDLKPSAWSTWGNSGQNCIVQAALSDMASSGSGAGAGAPEDLPATGTSTAADVEAVSPGGSDPARPKPEPQLQPHSKSGRLDNQEGVAVPIELPDGAGAGELCDSDGNYDIFRRVSLARKAWRASSSALITDPWNSSEAPTDKRKVRLQGAIKWREIIDILMNALVVASAGSLFVEQELNGEELAYSLGLGAATDNAASRDIFHAFEHTINAIFLIELIFRLQLLRTAFFWDKIKMKVQWFNILDCFIVLTCSFDLYILPVLFPTSEDASENGNLSSLRLLRLLRLTRALRVLRVMTSFSKLRILLNTTASSFMSLFWAMILMFLYVYGSALFMCDMLHSTMIDPTLPLDLRQWVFRYYGSGSKSVWTLFEITFSGGWPNYCRRIIEEVHWAFAIFYAAYVWVVVFAVTRIITALFLKDTLQVANEDTEMMLREQKAKAEKNMRKLKEMFALADESGDGSISLEEFKHVVQRPEVKLYFSTLDLDISECVEVFRMLDSGTGEVAYEDFCTGIMRLKGQARTLDVVSMMRDCRQIIKKLDELDGRIPKHGSK